MTIQRLALFLLLAFSPCIHADSLGSFEVGKKGDIKVANMVWEVIHFNGNWKLAGQRWHSQAEKNVLQEGQKLTFTNRFDPGFVLDSVYQLTTPNTLNYQANVQASSPFQANFLGISLTLPLDQYGKTEIQIGDQTIVAPEEAAKQPLVSGKKVQQISIPTTEGAFTITGEMEVTVVDARKFKNDQLLIRIGFQPSKGQVSSSHFQAALKLEPYSSNPIPLAPYANRSLIDEVANDYQGGWTDQGPKNDLRSFPGGNQKLGGVSFEIPQSSAGQKSVLALCGKPEYQFADAISVPVQNSEQANYLYLLHASAYLTHSPAYSRNYVTGKIHVTYTDGSTQDIEVIEQEDTGNWWRPFSYDNASVVWTGDNDESYVGLYLSRFPLQGKAIKNLTFSGEGKTAWMVLGAATSQAAIPLPQDSPHFIYADNKWKPFSFETTITKGSALDLSDFADAPAGKYGHVIVNEAGQMAFENKPDERVRFFGGNLNWTGNFPTHEEADRLAQRLRRHGYNSVRIHHYDVWLSGGWSPNKYEIDQKMLDRLDYLIHACKEQGLYISTDLYTFRRVTHPDLQKFGKDNVSAFKALIPIYPAAMEEWKRFARDVMTHKNPYTGMTWAEDPAIFSICPVNEDTIYSCYSNDSRVEALYREAFQQWKKQNPAKGLSEQEHFNEFLAYKQRESDREMRRFLREEIGTKALLTGNNWKVTKAQAYMRQEYDYVDNHCYWDHPSYPEAAFRLPQVHAQRSATAHMAGVPREVFMTRVLGKPFTVTEFNYVYPNKYRYESGPLMGTYSALQDWDGLYRFAWSHADKENVDLVPIGFSFNISTDPIQLLSDRLINFLWLRGDLPALQEEAEYIVTRQTAFKGVGGKPMPVELPEDAAHLGFTHKVGSRYITEADAATANKPFDIDPQNRYTLSSGGYHVEIEDAGNFLVKTPKSMALVLQTRSLDEAFVPSYDTPCMVSCASLDDKPIEESERLLVFHLTNVVSSGIEFGDPHMKNLKDYGRLPLLAHTGKASIAVPSSHEAEALKVYALDMSGNRVKEVPFEKKDGRVSFDVSVIGENDSVTFAYEIVRE